VAAVIWNADQGKWEATTSQYGSTWFDHPTNSPPAVPEPMSMVLGLMGLGSLAGYTKMRRRKN